MVFGIYSISDSDAVNVRQAGALPLTLPLKAGTLHLPCTWTKVKATGESKAGGIRVGGGEIMLRKCNVWLSVGGTEGGQGVGERGSVTLWGALLRGRGGKGRDGVRGLTICLGWQASVF